MIYMHALCEIHHCVRALLSPKRWGSLRRLIGSALDPFSQAPFVSFWYLLAPSATAAAVASGTGTGTGTGAEDRPRHHPWWSTTSAQRPKEIPGTGTPSVGRVHPLGSLPMHLRDSADPTRVRAKPSKGPRLSRDGRPLCRQCGQISGLCKHTGKS